MKRIVLGLLGAALMVAAAQRVIAEEFVNHYTVGGKCFVIVTEIIGSNSYTTEYTCAEYAPIGEAKLEKARRELEADQKRWADKDKRDAIWNLKNTSGAWPAIDVALNREGEAKWYPDKRAKALTALTEGKTVGEMHDLIKRLKFYMDKLPYAHFELDRLLDEAEHNGQGEVWKNGRFSPWTYHAFNYCGLKSSVFITQIYTDGETLSLGFGVDWPLTIILKGTETELLSATPDMCG